MLPIPARRATRWARDLDLPRGGETVLYTGHDVPADPVHRAPRRDSSSGFGDSPLARFSGLGAAGEPARQRRRARRPSVAQRERAEYDRVPTNVARLLQGAGVEFGYLYEDDLYSGALAHDLGADEVVAAHARKVRRRLPRSTACKTVITIDPHTTNMLRSVYPELVDGYDVRVRSYLEVLAERSLAVQQTLSGEVALHDSCVFARYENVVAEPRDAARADRPRGRGAGARRPAHLVLRRPGRVALSREGAGERGEARGAAAAGRARTA